MVELQILSRVLKDKNLSLLTLNNITDDYFITYQSEYEFIRDHMHKYGNVPDKETFLAKFPDFTIVEVSETDKYLIDTFNEEHLYAKAVPVVNKIAELMQTDANAAIEYLGSQLESEFGGRCFGIAANMDFLLVCTYEENGENPELVIYKKR